MMQSVARFLGMISLCLLATEAYAGSADVGSSTFPKMLLRIHPGGALADIEPEALRAISNRVSEALAQAGYDVTDPGAGDRKQGIRRRGKRNGVLGEFSHALDVVVGGAQKKQTPVGLSFGLGDPDPRSLDFQRANVTPIRCTMNRLKELREQGTLVQDRPAPSSPHSPGQWREAEQRAYARQIFSVCRFLLAKLDIPRNLVNSKDSTGGSAVRIETSYIDDPPTGRAPPALGVPPNPTRPPETTPAAKPFREVAERTPAETRRMEREAAGARSALERENKDGTSSAVKIERSDERKQITIFNSGDPLILEFGHNRR